MKQITPSTRRAFLQSSGAALGATALGLPGLARADTAVNFQLSWLHSVQFGGSYIALDRGYWADRGLDVSLSQGGPNAPVEPPVVSGTALVGISAADYTAAAVAQGAPFKIIAVAMQKNPFAIASLAANPVNSPADLIGKKIGMSVSNTPVLQALCTINDIDITQIEIVPTQYDPAPLVSGQVDCLLCWETDLPVAMDIQGVENTTMLMADHGYSVHSQTYIATEDSIANRRADLVSLLKGEVMGWNDYLSDTDAAAALTVGMFPDAGLDLATQELQAKRQVPLMFSDLTQASGFGWFTDETIAANVETLALLGRNVSADLWDRSLLEEAHA
ncbi:twin-arginine translocation pathway signal protein [Roseobacter denitrificans]|uniref:ABC transporter substrate-binding protein n=1 Tax=Roseobacter denitrificans TaxID=2434 RepID=UPI0002F4CA79|nr:ABC transporter substrate-binding protein [Roseobacter denitrificans]AVL51463.1 twin-arginine translocation pathway signal protein [Roseobacter denitrificans]SFG48216.1 NitT/TauT family transport system substrate-binding protein [Roseobacter denitrificans OCh 114]